MSGPIQSILHKNIGNKGYTFIPILSLKSTHITIVQSTRETGDIHGLPDIHGVQNITN